MLTRARGTDSTTLLVTDQVEPSRSDGTLLMGADPHRRRKHASAMTDDGNTRHDRPHRWPGRQRHRRLLRRCLRRTPDQHVLTPAWHGWAGRLHKETRCGRHMTARWPRQSGRTGLTPAPPTCPIALILQGAVDANHPRMCSWKTNGASPGRLAPFARAGEDGGVPARWQGCEVYGWCGGTPLPTLYYMPPSTCATTIFPTMATG